MSLDVQTCIHTAAGNDSTRHFAIPFQFQIDSSGNPKIKVFEADDTTKVATELSYDDDGATGYRITDAGSGDTAFNTAGIYEPDDKYIYLNAAALATGKTLVFYRDEDFMQEQEYTQTGPLNAASLEKALDKAMRMIQQLKIEVDRSIKQPTKTPNSDGDLSPTDGQVIVWDEATQEWKAAGVSSASHEFDQVNADEIYNKAGSGPPSFPTGATSSQAPSADSHLTRKDYVDDLDDANVKLTGTQTISGQKTFNDDTNFGGNLNVGDNNITNIKNIYLDNIYADDSLISIRDPLQLIGSDGDQVCFLTADSTSNKFLIDVGGTGHSEDIIQIGDDAGGNQTKITGGLDLSEGDITNVGNIALDSISKADGGTLLVSSPLQFEGIVNFGDNNITNVGNITLDSISADLTGGNVTINDNIDMNEHDIKDVNAFNQISGTGGIFIVSDTDTEQDIYNAIEDKLPDPADLSDARYYLPLSGAVYDGADTLILQYIGIDVSSGSYDNSFTFYLADSSGATSSTSISQTDTSTTPFNNGRIVVFPMFLSGINV